MRTQIKLLLKGLCLLYVFCLFSCTDILKEDPKSIVTVDYMKTAAGIQSTLSSAYSGLRFQYGPGGAMETTVIGTDEFTSTDAMNGTEGSLDTYNKDLNSSNGQIANSWNNNFTYINSCNGVVDFAPETDLSNAEMLNIVAQAKFLRAHYYFLLVQAYGGVPLDLGSGELKFNQVASSRSHRNTVAEVYDAIIHDLKDAVTDLPNRPAERGRATKGAALHFLAKTYLTRATSEAAQTDDYANAFKYADEVIKNQAQYGFALLQNYADVFKQDNEGNSEVVFLRENTYNYEYSESNMPGDGPKQNVANFFFTAGYERVYAKNTKLALVTRSVPYQRPWRMFIPTPWLINVAFADKTNDARFDDSFRMAWMCNNQLAADAAGIQVGDTAIYLPGREVTQAERDAHKYIMYAPSEYYKNSASQYMYPNLMKFDDVKRMNVNDVSQRPYIVAKLSETYLIAAEALIMQGLNAQALPYINAVRERAAYRPTNTSQQNAAAAAAMKISDPSVLNIDFILDERARELCGEQMRWFDLVRTKKLLSRVKQYNVKAAGNIQEFHMLRPIPQSQIDLLSEGDKASYQNPGYK